MPRDLRARAIVLRRTNYGESDRILNFLTPEGKVSALARGVRKEKSRLAGGIELFSVADIVIHQGRSNLGTLTSAKMLKFFGGILGDMPRLELAATFLKQLERAAEQISTPEHFSLLEQSLWGLDRGLDTGLISAWFTLNLRRIGGEELNLLYDTTGAQLSPDLTYSWDVTENALRLDPHGTIGAPEIKLARFLLNNSLARTAQISNSATIIAPILDISKKLS